MYYSTSSSYLSHVINSKPLHHSLPDLCCLTWNQFWPCLAIDLVLTDCFDPWINWFSWLHIGCCRNLMITITNTTMCECNALAYLHLQPGIAIRTYTWGLNILWKTLGLRWFFYHTITKWSPYQNPEVLRCYWCRCVSCFDCPSCHHTLSTRATTVTSGGGETDPEGQATPRKAFYLACGFCRWTSRDVAIKDQTVCE